jgi:uncharacterized membrane protein
VIKLKKQASLKIIMIIAICGILFSGYLSYNELFLSGCKFGCSVATGSILGLPPCVYGLTMYTIVFVVSLLGFKSKE